MVTNRPSCLEIAPQKSRGIACLFAFAAFSLICGRASAQQNPPPPAAVVHVDVTPDHILNSFDPDKAMGATLDVLSHAEIDGIFTPPMIQASLDPGWGPVSYRNNSELRFADWHWTENGTWSDPATKSGYWTSSADLKAPIRYAPSYSLPHRGFATSGDVPLVGGPVSYWKSNPYLTSKFTGESDSLHPQWVVVDLLAAQPVNAIRIAWVDPYATTYQVEYWVGRGSALDFDRGPQGVWTTFPAGAIKNSKGGTVLLKLADAPVSTRYVRILMSESSNTPDSHGSADIRNCVGYAIQTIAVGTEDAAGTFTDTTTAAAAATRAAATNRAGGAAGARRGGRGGGRGGGGSRAPTFCASSVDPWHSADDLVTQETPDAVHTGLNLFFTSGITNNLPATIPVAMIYGTPEDAANEIAYLAKRHYPVSYVEMGEEPDGKHVTPEDDAALYIQFAAAIHKLTPDAKLGGPIFEGVTEDIKLWPDAQGRTSWMGRFIDYLKEHGRISDLAFVSFEHYPFGGNMTWDTLYQEPIVMKRVMDTWRADGVPANVPLMITESSMAGGGIIPQMTRIDSAIWMADGYGSFFANGGAAFYHSPVQPAPITGRGGTWSTHSSAIIDDKYNVIGYSAFYWASHMLNLEWVSHRSGIHQMFPSSTDIKDSAGNLMVTTYALHRPDGNWSLMLVNRDQNTPHTVRVSFEDGASSPKFFAGPVSDTSYGSEQYTWHEDGQTSHADPDNPPVGTTAPGGADAMYVLPKASITVLRGMVK